jgi:hypothetical protein
MKSFLSILVLVVSLWGQTATTPSESVKALITRAEKGDAFWQFMLGRVLVQISDWDPVGRVCLVDQE